MPYIAVSVTLLLTPFIHIYSTSSLRRALDLSGLPVTIISGGNTDTGRDGCATAGSEAAAADGLMYPPSPGGSLGRDVIAEASPANEDILARAVRLVRCS